MTRIIPFIFLLAFITAEKCEGQSREVELFENSVPATTEGGALTDEFKSSLKRALSGVRIVALGEATHEDGLTFQYKTEVVKFLHEDLGFNVLAFEYGFYGNALVHQRLQQGENLMEATKYSGWSRSEFGFPVYEYVASTMNTDNPLHLAGFDGEKVPNGVPEVRQFIFETAHNNDFSVAEKDSLVLDSLITALYSGLGNPIKDQLTSASRNRAKELILSIDELLQRKGPGDQNLLSRLVLHSILKDDKATYAGSFRNIVRDKSMYERVVWLADSIYKNEKIILWGASAHFARNMVDITRDLDPDSYGYYPYYQMGDWLYAHYGDSFYSLAFIAGSGETGLVLPDDHKYKKYEEIRALGPYKTGSFEAVALATGYEALFCDLRNIHSSSWLNSEFTAHPFGYQADYVQWKKVLDGFFYMREMKPDVYLKH